MAPGLLQGLRSDMMCAVSPCVAYGKLRGGDYPNREWIRADRDDNVISQVG